MSRTGRRGVQLQAGVFMALWTPAWVLGQPVDESDRAPELPRAAEPPPAAGLPELETDCTAAQMYGGTEAEQAAFCQLEAHKYVSVRTLADRVLNADPNSFRGHFLMGVAQHLGEANLAKARFHLQRSQELFEARYGTAPDPMATETAVYRAALVELVYVFGEMDQHAEKIATVDLLRQRLEVDYSPLKAWPLMKLGRFDEAVRLAEEASGSPIPFFQAVGRTALCAVESERRRRDAAYAACMAAADPWLDDPSEGAIELTNAGAAAEEMGRFDEAEQLYMMAVARKPEGSANPYGRLTNLYVRQGRFVEALSSWRAMRDYRARRPGAHLDQQDEAEATMLGATLLMMGGRVEEAAKITRRVVERPDRKGTSSAAAEQAFAGVALVDHVVQTAAAERLAERASYAPWSEWPGLSAQATWHRLRAWRSGRKVLQVLADPERLTTSLRPELPGSIEGPTWMDPWIVPLVGSGVARSVIADGRTEETLPLEIAGPIFDVLEATAWAEAGVWRRAGPAAERAFAGLGVQETLLKVRAALIAAQAAEASGDRGRAVARWHWALRTEPGMVRRMGLSVPVDVQVADPGLSGMARQLLGSPRFRSATWGLRLVLSPDEAVLLDPDGTQVRRVQLEPLEAEEGAPPPGPDAQARARLDQIHAGLFTPVLDLTQGDLRSLDGVMGSGADADRMMDLLLAPH